VIGGTIDASQCDGSPEHLVGARGLIPSLQLEVNMHSQVRAAEPIRSLSPSRFSTNFTTPVAARPLDSGQIVATLSVRGGQNRQQLETATLLVKDFSVAKRPAVHVNAFLRTSRLYIDERNLRVAYQLRDAAGNVRVEVAQLDVRLTVGVPSTSCNGATPQSGCTMLQPVVLSCELPSNTTGIGVCATTLDASWFDLSGMSSVTVSVFYANVLHVARMLSTELRLQGKPLWWSNKAHVLGANGMFATLPASPRYANETITVQVYARAAALTNGTSGLFSWGFRLRINTSVLTYVSGSGSSLFNTAVVDVGSNGSIIGAVAVGTKPSTSIAQVTGGGIEIFTAVFKISSTAGAGVIENVLALHVDDMINRASRVIVTNQPGYVFGRINHGLLYNVLYNVTGCPDFDFNHATANLCPKGWSCTAGAAVKACQQLWTCHATGSYFQVSASDASSATSSVFTLPNKTSAMRYRHAGGADRATLSLIHTLDHLTSAEPLCTMSRSYDDNVLSRSRSSVGCYLGENAGGMVVFLAAKQPMPGQYWSRLLIDEIEFLDTLGNVLPMIDAMCDGSGNPPYGGELTILAPTMVGFFTYTDGDMALRNLAPFDGASTAQVSLSPVFVYERYSSADYHIPANSSLNSSLSINCSSTSAAFSIRHNPLGCVFSVGPSQTVGDPSALITIRSAGLPDTHMPMAVWYPSAFTISVEDAELNLIEDMLPPVDDCNLAPTFCTVTCAAYLYCVDPALRDLNCMYTPPDCFTVCPPHTRCMVPNCQTPFQLTAIYATADGLDVTSLVTFSSSNSDIAIVTGSTLVGMDYGVVNVSIRGLANSPSVQVVVTNVTVRVDHLVARLITGATWLPEQTPPDMYQPPGFSAGVQLNHNLRFEGDQGRIGVAARFSDKRWQSIHHSELVIQPLNGGPMNESFTLIPPSYPEYPYFRGEVPFGAASGCGARVDVIWRVCGGITMFETRLPVKIDQPTALNMTLGFTSTRLAPPDNPAVKNPINVPSSTEVTLTVTFQDKPDPVDYRLDPRATLYVVESQCGYLHNRNLLVIAGAPCTQLTVVATVVTGAFEFTINNTIPVVVVANMHLSFSAYPVTPHNLEVSKRYLSLIKCTLKYHHAWAHAMATLSDNTTYDVSDHTEYRSNKPTNIKPVGRRMRGEVGCLSWNHSTTSPSSLPNFLLNTLSSAAMACGGCAVAFRTHRQVGLLPQEFRERASRQPRASRCPFTRTHTIRRSSRHWSSFIRRPSSSCPLSTFLAEARQLRSLRFCTTTGRALTILSALTGCAPKS